MVLCMHGVAPIAQDSRAEAVMHAADAVTAGLWRLVDDGSAASGRRAVHPDSGAAKLTSPLATPANYLELTFDAAAGRAYRLWIRGRADRDYYGNDSVFVQFSGTVNASGTPMYRIGSTSATSGVIEACSACGLRGWGWADNLYGGTGFGAPL
jgi:hypothetical protein